MQFDNFLLSVSISFVAEARWCSDERALMAANLAPGTSTTA